MKKVLYNNIIFSHYQSKLSVPFFLDMSFSNSLVQFEGNRSSHQCLMLDITDDNDAEGNEELALMLVVVNTTQPFYMDIKPSYMMVEIIDDDSK